MATVSRVKTFFTGTPPSFPLIALFHVFWMVRAVVVYWGEPFPSAIWMQLLWLAGYTAFWGYATFGRKWAANAYIALTVLNLVLRFLIKDAVAASAFTDALFPIDVLCAFILLVFYKRLR